MLRKKELNKKKISQSHLFHIDLTLILANVKCVISGNKTANQRLEMVKGGFVCLVCCYFNYLEAYS